MERSVGAQQEAAATEAMQASFDDFCDKGWRCPGTKERKAMKALAKDTRVSRLQGLFNPPWESCGPRGAIQMEGNLYKRGQRGGWRRRWFVIAGTELLYYEAGILDPEAGYQPTAGGRVGRGAPTKGAATTSTTMDTATTNTGSAGSEDGGSGAATTEEQKEQKGVDCLPSAADDEGGGLCRGDVDIMVHVEEGGAECKKTKETKEGDEGRNAEDNVEGE